MPDEPAAPRAVRATLRAIGRARSLACFVYVLARRVLLSLAGSHVRSPLPLAGLADGATLIGHHRRGRQPAAVGRGSSMAARSTIGGGHACCSRQRAAARESRRGSRRSPGGHPLVCAMRVSPVPMSCAHVRRCLIYFMYYCGRNLYVESSRGRAGAPHRRPAGRRAILH